MSEPAVPAGVVRLHVRVEGRVQGVGFRRFVQRAAADLGLAGWARNLTDGAVEVAAVGSAEAVGSLRRRLLEGPPYAVVDRLVEVDGGATGELLSPFRLLPDAAPGTPAPDRPPR